MYYRLIQAIKNYYFSKVTRVWLEKDYPLLFIATYFLMGQGLISAIPLSKLTLGTYFFICLLLYIYKGTKYFAILMLLGGISALPLQFRKAPELKGLQYILLKVTDIPEYPSAGAIKFRAEALILKKAHNSINHLTINNKNTFTVICNGVDLPWENISKIKKGDTAIAWVDIHNIKTPTQPFQYEAYLWRKAISAKCKVRAIAIVQKSKANIITTLRDQLITSTKKWFGDNETTSLLLAMTLGTETGISGRTDYAFKTLGLTHILVVSGYHFALLFAILLAPAKLLVRLLPIFLTPRWLRKCALIFVLGLLIFYSFIVGHSISTSRALIAIILFVLTILSERGYSFLNTVIAALLMLSFIWPGTIFEVGTQLTFAALLGIYFGIRLSEYFDWSDYLVIPITATLSSQFICLFWFKEFSLWSVPANLLLASLSSVLICNIGLIGIIFYYINSWLAYIFLWFAWHMTYLFRESARFISYLNWGVWELALSTRMLLALILIMFGLYYLSFLLIEYLQARRIFRFK